MKINRIIMKINKILMKINKILIIINKVRIILIKINKRMNSPKTPIKQNKYSIKLYLI